MNEIIREIGDRMDKRNVEILRLREEISHLTRQQADDRSRVLFVTSHIDWMRMTRGGE